MDKLVSIIVPCYNMAKYLPETIESILDQTYTNWECIIVNDGSTDESLSIANNLADLNNKIFVVNQQNKGLSEARNAGISIAKGNFILPIDADDLISTNYLEVSLSEFKQNPNTKLVYGKAQKFGATNEEWNLSPYSYKSLLFSNMIYCTAMYEKISWENSGGYDSKMIHGFEDWEFWLNILNEDSKVICNKQITFFYRVKDNSMYNSMSIEHIEIMRRQIYLKHYKKYEFLFKDPIKLYHEKEIALMNFQRLLNRPDWYLKQIVKKLLNKKTN